MGTMGYGYGSEFHLLRWMGRHRELLTAKVEDATGLERIRWLDFEFDCRKDIPDAELKGLNFLKEDGHYDDVMSAYTLGKISWPQRGEQMNWDAVGISGDTYILCEAKAHVEEIERKHDPGNSASIGQRERAFSFAKKVVGAKKDADWMRNFYQMANRLYILALLKKCNVKAVLLNMYFCGDKFPNGNYVCPRTPEEWRPIIREEFSALGLPENCDFVRTYIKEVFLPVSIKK